MKSACDICSAYDECSFKWKKEKDKQKTQEGKTYKIGDHFKINGEYYVLHFYFNDHNLFVELTSILDGRRWDDPIKIAVSGWDKEKIDHDQFIKLLNNNDVKWEQVEIDIKEKQKNAFKFEDWNFTPAEVMKKFDELIAKIKGKQPEETYSIGDYFLIDGKHYILSVTGGDYCILTCIEDGGMFYGEVEVEDYSNITKEEFLELLGDNKDVIFKKIDKKDIKL